MLLRKIAKYRSVIIYGLSLALLLIILQWLELRFVIISHAFEVYVALVAILFTLLGIWLAMKLARPAIETRIEYKEIQREDSGGTSLAFEPNKELIAQTGLSKRELEVLQLISEGLSNQEIAGRLFVSLNTIKTHSANLFAKLDVKRRTQAIEKARRLNIIR